MMMTLDYDGNINIKYGYDERPLFVDSFSGLCNDKELSDKEIKIIKCICEAKDRNEIAEELNITLGTLKNYISNILTKLEFDNITKLTIFCLSNGYIVPNQK